MLQYAILQLGAGGINGAKPIVDLLPQSRRHILAANRDQRVVGDSGESLRLSDDGSEDEVPLIK